MPRYDYRSDDGQVVELQFPMGDAPESLFSPELGLTVRRVYAPPAAIHFHGPGFYSTEVTGRMHRRRRKNPGDDLPKDFDVAAAAITGTL